MRKRSLKRTISCRTHADRIGVEGFGMQRSPAGMFLVVTKSHDGLAFQCCFLAIWANMVIRSGVSSAMLGRFRFPLLT